MASCEHLQRTSMYFDGELPPGEERDATEHIATCAECQAVLGDAVGLHALLSHAKSAVVAAAPRRRRWPLAVGAATVLAAAAAIAIIVLRPRVIERAPPERVALMLAPTRGLEARFTGEQLGKHRPYVHATEHIDARAIAELEARGDKRDLVGALASIGQTERAGEVARTDGGDAAALSDLAAIALANGDAEGALGYAQQALARDRELTAAIWNLGLATRQLKLFLVSRAAFLRVASRGEAGWAAEAQHDVAALGRDLLRASAEIAAMHDDFRALTRAGSVRNLVAQQPATEEEADAYKRRAMRVVRDQTPIDLMIVRAYPSQTWLFLYESLAAATPGIAEGLEPVAGELDLMTGDTAASDLVKHAVANKATNARVAALLAAAQTRSLTAAERGELAKAREPFAALYGANADRAQCTSLVFALPCAKLMHDMVMIDLAAKRPDDALRAAEAARDFALAAGLMPDYVQLADQHALAGRAALAAAEREEAALVKP